MRIHAKEGIESGKSAVLAATANERFPPSDEAAKRNGDPHHGARSEEPHVTIKTRGKNIEKNAVSVHPVRICVPHVVMKNETDMKDGETKKKGA